jgi:hypothetical protein
MAMPPLKRILPRPRRRNARFRNPRPQPRPAQGRAFSPKAGTSYREHPLFHVRLHHWRAQHTGHAGVRDGETRAE